MNNQTFNFSSSSNYSYLTDPAYQAIKFTFPIQIYYIICGTIATLLNLYPIILFTQFKKLRNTPCNWIIIFQCLAELLIGFGTFMRGVTFLYAVNYTIMEFNLIFCTFVGGLCSLGFRTGQAIALLMAIDRFLAIWKPEFYVLRQGNKTVSVNAVITLVVFTIILSMFVYGFTIYDTISLNTCLYSTGTLYEQVIPIYSALVTIVFFVMYIGSLVLFYLHIASTKKQQAHATSQISKMQKKLFISVSLVLFCFTAFYVFPSTLQMLKRYFGLTGNIFHATGYFNHFGSVFNGCLNAIIYLTTHQEFKTCSWQFIYRLLGKKNSVGLVP